MSQRQTKTPIHHEVGIPQTPVSDDTEQRKEVNKMLTKNEQKTIERLAVMMQNMDEMQKAQLCAFAEGLAMALEHSKRAS